MKISKKAEKEILSVYNAYFDNYLKGNVKAIAPLLDDGYTQIGSAEEEVFFDKKGALKFLHDTIGQVAGKVEMRNRFISLEPHPSYVLVTELTDLFVLTDSGWTFHSKFRASSLMQKKARVWKITHQHSSFPDIRAAEGENIAIGKIEAENIQLRDAIKRRTVELEHRNRYLEIEAALERVRARTMAMQHSEELSETAFMLSQQFRELGEVPDQITIGIINEKEKVIQFWLTVNGKQVNQTAVASIDEPTMMHKVYVVWKKKMKSLVVDLVGQELKKYLKYREQLSRSSKVPVFSGKNPTRRLVHAAFFSKGLITFSSDLPRPKESLRMLERFAAVFEQTYTRFLDLQKAEAQTREAKIEAALERIRGRAMAMHSSTELMEVADVLREQMALLGQPELETAALHFYEEEPGHIISWRAFRLGTASKGKITKGRMAIPNNACALVLEWLELFKSDSPEYTVEVSGAKQKEWYKVLFRLAPEVGKAMVKRKSTAEPRYYHFSTFSGGALLMVSISLPSEESMYLQRRAAGVFDLAYRRFLDLKHAEAQAREARIETALEKVRSRTLAMQRSEELAETAHVLFQQFKELGEAPDQITIGIVNEEKGTIGFWVTQQGATDHTLHEASVDEPTLMKKIFVAWKKQKKSIEVDLSGKELKQYVQYRSKLSGRRILKKDMEGHRVINVAVFSKGILSISTSEPKPAETIHLLERFAGVFDGTYTRFLDLKQAEAQAREAKIEASLERVRARTMAMHKSDEMVDTSTVLFRELKALGVETIRTGIGIVDGAKKTVEIWSTQWAAQQENKILGLVPVSIHPFFKGYFEAWQKKSPFFSFELKGDEVPQYYKALSPIISYAPRKTYNPKEIFYTFIFADGSINVIATENLSEEVCGIMVRFAKVFELIYRRFRDLQKAEAQAREARIEVALERVRSRSMAMFKSEELSDVAEVLFKQVSHLGEMPDRISICVIDETKQSYQTWATDQAGAQLMVKPVANLKEKTTIRHLYTDWKAGKKSSLIELQGVDLKNWIGYVRRELGMPISTDRSQVRRFHNVAHFSHGWLNLSSSEPLVGEVQDLLQRFASVFSLTYTRFLDLQKAEAQAREARIEASLERVRAKTMAMHSSEDVSAATATLFTELEKLGIENIRGGITIISPKQTQEVWSITNLAEGKTIRSIGNFDMRLHPFWQQLFKGWKNKEEFQHYWLGGNDKAEYITILNATPNYLSQPIKEIPDVHIQSYFFGEGAVWANSIKPHTEEDKQIMKRFASVFNQTYTRFLDLQKAEAQAREVQIQLALERVRAGTMAMQKSEELAEVATLLFQQFRNLGLLPPDIARVFFSLIDEKSATSEIWTTQEDGILRPGSHRISLNANKHLQDVFASWKARKTKYIGELTGTEVMDYLNYQSTLVTLKEDTMLQLLLISPPDKLVFTEAIFKQGTIGIISTDSLLPESHNTLTRFAVAFEQTYTRFLDLQKAEAQAKEAKIEAALERVRSRSLAMHHSSELSTVVDTLLQEFTGLEFSLTFCIINLIDGDDRSNTVWAANPETGKDAESYYMKFEDYDFHRAMWNAWKAQDKRFVYTLEGKEKRIYDQYLFSKTEFRRFPTHVQEANKALPRYVAGFTFFKYSGLQTVSVNEITEAELEILERFGKVFEQSYIRFLDLQKAEAQAMEAKIEAALERVRSKTMAMHNSSDVGKTVATLFEELVKLGVETVRCGILVHNNATANQMEVWTAKSNTDGDATLFTGQLDMKAHPMLEGAYQAWQCSESIFEYKMAGEDLINYYQAINQTDSYPLQFDVRALPIQQYHTDFIFPDGMVFAFTEERIPTAEVQIFKRFAGVFGQTYRRYLDLQKAEAQALEARIEAALERVRSKTMAMHKSEQLPDTAQVLFEQFAELGKIPDRIGIGIINEKLQVIEWWVTDQLGSQVTRQFEASLLQPTLAKWFAAWKAGKDALVIDLSGNDLKEWIRFVRDEVKMPIDDSQIKGRRVHHAAFFSQGLLLISAHEPMPKETMQLLVRFAKVFSQTYTRFLDLKKAEAQAREATIEAALEKVRGKAMAMHNPEDLASTVRIFYSELVRLNSANVIRVGAGLLNKENHIADLTSVSKSTEGDLVEVQGKLDMAAYPILKEVYQNWLIQKEFCYALRGNEIKEYYQFLKGQVGIPDYPNNAVQYFYYPMFAEGSFYVVSENELSDGELQVFRRFSAVLSLTYKRYKELKDAEVRGREAIKQAALDRVRAEIASMRTVSDLDRITPLIWRELTTLGIPFVRCGVFIMDEQKEVCHAFLSTPEGKSIAAVLMPYSSENIKNAIEPWRNKRVYTDHWDGARFIEFWNEMTKMGANAQQAEYQVQHPPEHLHLHFLPFLQGMLYVGNVASLGQEEMNLLQSVADAFSTAYARYEDFNKLETAKLQVENTLSDLKQAQTQLVQSEKMASLGELTAGIAHEIQNPLNFVNNFSEVSKELLDEMKEELEKGNAADAKQIAADVIQNLEKINFHGKRADGIVKSMLQHSRKSTGQKELTDLNALCDEYLRLSYHGLRAKDKSFNAKFEIIFDPSIEKIDVIPQEIGRVVLNLINNAFYAVTEKKKLSLNAYEPIVTITTSKKNNRVEIRVSDNGSGIPQKVLDKIFQPFFTTKPTGQGTGLGLSLSYDIVKAHGGELKVETKEGEGTEFIVELPLNK